MKPKICEKYGKPIIWGKESLNNKMSISYSDFIIQFQKKYNMTDEQMSAIMGISRVAYNYKKNNTKLKFSQKDYKKFFKFYLNLILK